MKKNKETESLEINDHDVENEELRIVLDYQRLVYDESLLRYRHLGDHAMQLLAFYGASGAAIIGFLISNQALGLSTTSDFIAIILLAFILNNLIKIVTLSLKAYSINIFPSHYDSESYLEHFYEKNPSVPELLQDQANVFGEMSTSYINAGQQRSDHINKAHLIIKSSIRPILIMFIIYLILKMIPSVDRLLMNIMICVFEQFIIHVKGEMIFGQ